MHVLDLFFPDELSILKLTFIVKDPVGMYLSQTTYSKFELIRLSSLGDVPNYIG